MDQPPPSSSGLPSSLGPNPSIGQSTAYDSKNVWLAWHTHVFVHVHVAPLPPPPHGIKLIVHVHVIRVLGKTQMATTCQN